MNTRNLRKAVRAVRGRVEARTGITNWGVGSVARNLSESVAAELFANKKVVSDSFQAMQLGSAKGKALDSVARSVSGVERAPATRATIKSGERSLVIFTDTTFGAINSGNDIILPTGTKISANGISFSTDKAYTLSAASSITYISANADGLGSKWNVPAHALTTHDFTGYTDSANKTLKVSNLNPVLNGSDVESDEKLRFRATARNAALQRNNGAANRLAGLSIPGVQDVRVIEGYYGLGTAAVVVFGADGESNQSLANEVAVRLRANKAVGLDVRATPGLRVYVELELRVALAVDIPQDRKQRLTFLVRSAVRDYLSGNVLLTRLNLGSLKQHILSKVPDITALSTDTSGLFDKVWISRGYASSRRVSEREEVIGQVYQVEEDEYFYPGPINLTFEN